MMNLFDVNADQADEQALTDLSRCRTWRELNDNIMSLAAAFQQVAGMKPGDHVALHVSNRFEFIEALLAGIVAGLWVTPINTHLTTDEAAWILNNCDARLLLHDTEHNELARAAVDVASVCVESDVFHDWLGLSDAARFSEASPAGGTMLYTSGTTGHPKGVMRAKPEYLGDAIAKMRTSGRMFGLEGSGPHLVTGPLYHAAPMLFALYDLLNGARMVIMPRWDVAMFHRCVNRYQVCTTHLVPTMMVRLLQDRVANSSLAEYGKHGSLSHVLHGAAPIARHTKEAMLAWWGEILCEYWGGSEAGVTTLVDSHTWRSRPGTVGRPLPHFSVYVGDSAGNPVPAQEGELFCRHRDLAQVFAYYKDPAKTENAHPQPYVFSIGDSGYVDEDGFVYLSGRRSDLIISGGVNIYPAEIEQVLSACDVVVDCAVLGVDDPEWGEQVIAVIQLVESTPPNAASRFAEPEAVVRQFLEARLARFKIPRQLLFVQRIPRMPTGKVKQSALRQLVADQIAPHLHS